MTTLSTRLQLLKPDDGGPGGDDTVNVTTQISDNYDKIDDALGIYHVANFGAMPVVNNYVGRLVQTDDNGKIFQYNGAGWTFIYVKPFNIEAHTGNNLASGSNLGVGNVWTTVVNNIVVGQTIFTLGVDSQPRHSVLYPWTGCSR